MISPRKTFVFIHQNMPGQFLHIIQRLARDGHNVYFITKENASVIPGVNKITYKIGSKPAEDGLDLVRPVEDAVLHGRAVAKGLSFLKENGVFPDMIVGHSGWGELLFAKDVFPNVPLIAYLEYYYGKQGSDVGFDPEYPSSPHVGRALLLRNSVLLMTLEVCDVGISPTMWQWSLFPEIYRPKIRVIHEGVNTSLVRPVDGAEFTLPDGRVLKKGEEIVTYVARNLEPYRGVHIYMRAVAELCRRRPNTQFILIGGDETSYGPKRLDGKSHKQKALEEVTIDPSRVHFLGKVPYDQYLKVLQVSSAHVYLTYPFVLSWSMIESLSAGCAVVGSRTPPVQEVLVDKQNGRLVDFFNPTEIADVVTGALERPEDFQPYRAAARRSAVERYDIDTVTVPRLMALMRDYL